MVKVKICGIQRLEDAMEAARLGADFLGFNLYTRSPRYIAPERIVPLLQELPETFQSVGLFVNEPRTRVEEIVRACRFDVLQFHGDERKEFHMGWTEKVIKVVRMKDATSKQQVEKELESADWVLADATIEGYGGGGKVFPWKWLEGISGDRLFLAGGLHPGNVAAAVRFLRPYAVDVASGVEISPGVKDWKRLGEFIENAKSA